MRSMEGRKEGEERIEEEMSSERNEGRQEGGKRRENNSYDGRMRKKGEREEDRKK